MKNEQLYQKTVDILLDAFNDKTLVAGNCYACAVGNIVAANCGFKMKADSAGWPYWDGCPPYFVNTDIPDKSAMNPEIANYIGNVWISVKKGIEGVDEWQVRNNIPAMDQIRSTGYSPEEILRIERAFEYPTGYYRHTGLTMLSRLISVIKELGEIHETKEEDTTLSINKFQGISKKQLQTV